MNPDNEAAEVSELVDHLEDETSRWSSSAIKRLDHAYNILETVAQHSNDQTTIDATKSARNMIEAAQEDVREIEDGVKDVNGEVWADAE